PARHPGLRVPRALQEDGRREARRRRGPLAGPRDPPLLAGSEGVCIDAGPDRVPHRRAERRAAEGSRRDGRTRQAVTPRSAARARTSAFVATNLGRYEVFAVSILGKDLRPVKYREEVDEGPTHKTTEVRFPPSGGKLPISATKDGNPDPVDLEAGPTARDMLST